MPAGRPSKFKPEFVEQVAKLCSLAATDVDIADFFEVDVATLNRWKLQNPEFCESLKVAKDAADNRVERSLFARATGYEHPDTDIRVVDGQIVQTEMRKHYPPDTTAAIFWLKNRRSKDWRDRTETEVTGKDGAPLIPEMSEEEIARRIAYTLAAGLKPKE